MINPQSLEIEQEITSKKVFDTEEKIRVWRVYQNGRNLWVTTYNGLYHCDANSKEAKFTKVNLNTISGINYTSNYRIRGVLEDKKNNLWVTVDSIGLLFKPRGAETFYVHEHNPSNMWSLSNNYLTSIYSDKNENIWIGSEKGFEFTAPHTTFHHYIRNRSEPFAIQQATGNWYSR